MGELTRRDRMALALLVGLGKDAGGVFRVHVAFPMGPTETGVERSVRLADQLIVRLDEAREPERSHVTSVRLASAVLAVLGEFGPLIEEYMIGTMRLCGDIEHGKEED